VGIATEPLILGDLLARLLERVGVDEVVDLLDAAGSANGDGLELDAVVTTIALPDTVHADVVLSLPASSGGEGPAVLRVGGRESVIDVDGLAAILRLLDEQVPAVRPRLDRL
jgi:hypothetical protein